MPIKLVPTTFQCSCSKCERNVIFRYIERQVSAHESSQPQLRILDEMIDYGQCPVANNAKIPKHPIVGEMDECPCYQALANMR